MGFGVWSYLCGRKQYVHFNGENSNQQDVTCGVHQGSVLGPLLFIVYTNDLPNALNDSQSILFADDTTIYHSSNDPKLSAKILDADLKLLTDWLRANKLSLNITKTNYMIFSNALPDIELKIGAETINRVNEIKFLCVYIDIKLNWNKQLIHCKNKLSSGLYALKTVTHLLPTEHLKSQWNHPMGVSTQK